MSPRRSYASGPSIADPKTYGERAGGGTRAERRGAGAGGWCQSGGGLQRDLVAEGFELADWLRLRRSDAVGGQVDRARQLPQWGGQLEIDQTENLVLWTQRSQENGLEPDAQSGDEDPKLRPHCDMRRVTGGDKCRTQAAEMAVDQDHRGREGSRRTVGDSGWLTTDLAPRLWQPSPAARHPRVPQGGRGVALHAPARSPR
jgi:hypothetical protein